MNPHQKTEKQIQLFYSNDFNFSGMSQAQLKFICEHRLPLRTPFAKLVIYLYDLFFTYEEPVLEQNKLIDRFIEIIGHYCNETMPPKEIINVFDEKIQNELEQSFKRNCDSNDCAVNLQELDYQVVKKVHHTLKSNKFMSSHAQPYNQHPQQSHKKNKNKQRTIWL